MASRAPTRRGGRRTARSAGARAPGLSHGAPPLRCSGAAPRHAFEVPSYHLLRVVGRLRQPSVGDRPGPPVAAPAAPWAALAAGPPARAVALVIRGRLPPGRTAAPDDPWVLSPDHGERYTPARRYGTI